MFDEYRASGGAPGGAPELKPVGEYDIEVLEATVRPGKKAPMITTKTRILSGEYAGQALGLGVFSASPDAQSIFVQNMLGFGITGAEPQSTTLEGIAQLLKGRKVRVKVGENEYPPNSGTIQNQLEIGAVKLLEDTSSGVGVPDGAPAGGSTPAF